MTEDENLTLSQYQRKDLEMGEGGYVSPSPPLLSVPLYFCPLFPLFFSPFLSLYLVSPPFHFPLLSPSLLDLRWRLGRARISRAGAGRGVGLAEMCPSLAAPLSPERMADTLSWRCSVAVLKVFCHSYTSASIQCHAVSVKATLSLSHWYTHGAVLSHGCPIKLPHCHAVKHRYSYSASAKGLSLDRGSYNCNVTLLE